MPVGSDGAERRLRETLVSLIEASFQLWGVAARVGPGPDGCEIEVEGVGHRLVIRRMPDEELFGWLILDLARECGAGERPCSSVLGVLGALRGALDPEWSGSARLRAGYMAAAS